MTATLADLTREQVARVAAAVKAQDRVEITRLALEADQATLQRAVYDAMTDGVPARVLADELGLSLARVYQLRHIDSNQT